MIELWFLAYILFDSGKKFLSCDPACLAFFLIVFRRRSNGVRIYFTVTGTRFITVLTSSELV